MVLSVFAHAALVLFVVPLKPMPPCRLVIVVPVFGLTTSPVVSWSEMVKMTGMPSMISSDAKVGSSTSVLLLRLSVSNSTSPSMSERGVSASSVWISFMAFTMSCSSERMSSPTANSLSNRA